MAVDPPVNIRKYEYEVNKLKTFALFHLKSLQELFKPADNSRFLSTNLGINSCQELSAAHIMDKFS